MIIGFTGTRDGMSDEQHAAITRLLQGAAAEGHVTVRHGDCVGADQEFHEIAQSLGLSIIIHPPKEQSLRAFCQGAEILPPKDYLARDRDIVSLSDSMLATPKSRVKKGGTWYTIGVAQLVNKLCLVVFPDGLIVEA
jgi:hypothetical protein